jgi:hypothetical protein
MARNQFINTDADADADTAIPIPLPMVNETITD